jgi:hypothetical protein
MSTQTSPQRDAETMSGWVTGAYAFAAIVMLIIGFFQILAGLAAIFEDEFFVVGRNYAYDLDVTAWGWIHLIMGVVVLLAGWGLFSAQTWARSVAVTLAVLSALVNFFFIPFYPFWSLTVIALAVWVIWSLVKPLPYETR